MFPPYSAFYVVFAEPAMFLPQSGAEIWNLLRRVPRVTRREWRGQYRRSDVGPRPGELARPEPTPAPAPATA